MVMNFFRKAVLIWMIAWLPASGAMAAVVPISGMSGGAILMRASDPSLSAPKLQNQITDSSVMPCHQGVADDISTSTDSRPSGTCTHCVLCHLAVSLMLPSLPVVQATVPSREYSATSLSPHASFVPDLASPPPKTFAR
jgi:hypothetical protein